MQWLWNTPSPLPSRLQAIIWGFRSKAFFSLASWKNTDFFIEKVKGHSKALFEWHYFTKIYSRMLLFLNYVDGRSEKDPAPNIEMDHEKSW